MTRAGVYVRISSDPEGTALGVERQTKDCQELAMSKGWSVIEVYRDNDFSATRDKPRPAYQRLLADIRTGRIDAVVVWDLDRLHRRPIELEEFITLAKQHSLDLASVGGKIDLATEQGVMLAGMKAQVARYESAQLSRRVRRKQQELREAGKPFGGGHRPYGYDPTRRHVVEAEAAVLQEVAARLIRGETMSSIVADLNDRQVRPARAERWTVTSLRAVIGKPRIAGQLTYRNEVVRRAVWPPILDEETFARVQVALDARRPARRVSGARKYLLSGIAVCGVCGVGLQVAHRQGGALGYRCPSREAHLSRDMAHLDRHVVSELRVFAAEHPFRVSEWEDPEQSALSEQVAVLEARKTEAAVQFADGALPADMLQVIGSRLQAQIDSLTAQRGQSRAVAFDRIRWVTFDFGGWETLPLAEKRTALALYCRSITVHPVKRLGRGFDPSSVEVTFRDPGCTVFQGIAED